MGNMFKKEWIKRLLAVTLSLVVAVTFIPLLGDAAFAEGEDTNEDIIADQVEVDADAPAPDEDADTDMPEIDEPAEDGANTDEVSDEAQDIINNDTGSVDQNCTLIDGGTVKATLSDPVTGSDFKALESTNTNYCYFGMSRRGSIITVNAYIKTPGINTRYLEGLYLDGTKIANGGTDVQSVSDFKIDLGALKDSYAGFHTLSLKTCYKSNGNEANTYTNTFRIGLISVPSSSGSIAVYHNYLDYMSPVDPNLINYKLFLEYNGRVYGPMSYLQSAKIAGLAPNSNYGIISYYGVYKDGSWFTGKEEGRYRSLGTYRTGAATAPKIKSIKVKATKVKKKTQKVYGYYTGLYLGKRKYYKYSIKITVKLKKAPGTNGIWINGKKFKGNKKKYTVKLGPYTNYSKPKGKKFTVMIYSYYNGSYGGYSPLYKTVKKVK